jgi:homoserine kinase type II
MFFGVIGVTVSLSEIMAVLSRYPAEVVAVPSLTPATGGFSGASVWKLESRAGRFALRVWPFSGMPPARIHGLHRLLGYLASSGLRTVAAPVAAQDGTTLVSCAGRYWQLEPWMPGTADFHLNPTCKRLATAMRALADWHRAAATWKPDPDDRPWFTGAASAASPAAPSRCRQVAQWLSGKLEELKSRVSAGVTEPRREFPAAEVSSSRQLWTPDSESPQEASAARFTALTLRILADFEAAAPHVRSELDRVSTLRFRLQPCLRDIWHDHVLWTGDAVTGLIDPSAACSENVAADLSRLLGSLVRDDGKSWRAGIDEYRKCVEFSDSEELLCGALDRSGVLLSPMTWLERRYLQGRKIEAEPDVMDRLEGQSQRLRTLAERSTRRDPL